MRPPIRGWTLHSPRRDPCHDSASSQPPPSRSRRPRSPPSLPAPTHRSSNALAARSPSGRPRTRCRAPEGATAASLRAPLRPRAPPDPRRLPLRPRPRHHAHPRSSRSPPSGSTHSSPACGRSSMSWTASARTSRVSVAARNIGNARSASRRSPRRRHRAEPLQSWSGLQPRPTASWNSCWPRRRRVTPLPCAGSATRHSCSPTGRWSWPIPPFALSAALDRSRSRSRVALRSTAPVRPPELRAACRAHSPAACASASRSTCSPPARRTISQPRSAPRSTHAARSSPPSSRRPRCG